MGMPNEPLGGQPPANGAPSVKDFNYEVKYHRAFEAMLWSMPATSIYGFRRAFLELGPEGQGLDQGKGGKYLFTPPTTKGQFRTATSTFRHQITASLWHSGQSRLRAKRMQMRSSTLINCACTSSLKSCRHPNRGSSIRSATATPHFLIMTSVRSKLVSIRSTGPRRTGCTFLLTSLPRIFGRSSFTTIRRVPCWRPISSSRALGAEQ